MFREMRRRGQRLNEKECLEILDMGTSGVLALSGDDGYPYAVPLSYARCGMKIYFHSALSGHKVDAVKRCEKASFCVIGRDDVVPEKYSTRYKSVIVFGRIRLIKDDNERESAAKLLGRKYCPEDTKERMQAEIDRWMPSMAAFELSIEYMTGKKGQCVCLTGHVDCRKREMHRTVKEKSEL